MAKILGIDLGTNSIGWVIRETNNENTENQFSKAGILTFDKGVGEGKSGEFPLVQARTTARGIRRNYQATKYRKWNLLKFLINNKMCPLTHEELNKWKTYTKGIGRIYPQSEKFINWLRYDFNNDSKPDFDLFGYDKHESYYVFRMLVVQEDITTQDIFKNNPYVLGRLLYQIAQCRGYKGRDEEEAKTIMEGSKEDGPKGRNDITEYIEKYKTLGAALYYLQKDNNVRIRQRYNLRTDIDNELKEICRVQKLGEEAYKHLAKAIVWQRPLRNQKGLVGICTFEKNKSRCPISHPLYEEYRAWVFINNLKIKLPQHINKQKYLKEKIYPLFFNKSKEFELNKIIKTLQKDGGKINSNFNEKTKVISCSLMSHFNDLLGESWKEKYGWEAYINNEKKPDNCKYSFDDIWHVLFTFNDKEKLKEFASQKLGLDEETATKFSKLQLQQGYATLSLSAIKKIKPYLQQGFMYSETIYLANMHKVLGQQKLSTEILQDIIKQIDNIMQENETEKNIIKITNALINDFRELPHYEKSKDKNYQLNDIDKKEILQKLNNEFGETTWKEKDEQEQHKIFSEIANNYQKFLQDKTNSFSKIAPLHDKIFAYLKNAYNAKEEYKKYLWHPSIQEAYPNAKEKNGIKILGNPQPISRGFKNPMALRTLHELRKLVNYLLLTEQIDEDTRVVIEIARELNDANKRKAIEKWQNKREEENKKYIKEIQDIKETEGLNIDPENKDIINKYRLWKEQNKTCIYTGKKICGADIFNGNNYDFEHTIPASISFDNESKNLTIADSIYNRNIKQNKLPTECPNYKENCTINGITYTAIEPRLEFIKDEIKKLESQLIEYINKTKFASSKEIKDNCIQRRHIIKFDLDYWRQKLNTFTIKEYKSSFRNSQLRDTQIITKYALPYFKTAFTKVEVQKGSVVSAFRKIYKIEDKAEKKDRNTHSHHAVDAAILTLIPSASTRDKILKKYFEEKEKTKKTYHCSPPEWDNFNHSYIKDLAQNVINNFQSKNRILTPTYKNVRKRGRQQYVKYKDSNGKWHYKTDRENNKIPLIAKGDNIRGQLHKESFYGMIKLPNGEQKKELSFVVMRIPPKNLKSVEDIENIVINTNLKNYLKTEIITRINNGLSFEQAISKPIWAFGKKEDKNGNPIQALRHIRCKVKGGGGFISNPKEIKYRQNFKSKKDYKNFYYAQNDEVPIFAIYQAIINGKKETEMQRFSILELARLSKLTPTNDKNNIAKLIPSNIKSKKEKYLLPLLHILNIGQKVIFFKENKNELKNLDIKNIFKKLYFINKSEEGKISFKHHINSMSNENLKKKMIDLGKCKDGAPEINFDNPLPKLRLTQANWNFAVEGKDFNILLDGTIKWLF